jgi:hypothetical protein
VIYAAIIIFVVAALYAVSNIPKTPGSKPAALGDFNFPQYDEGTSQAVLFGDDWTDGWMVLGYGNYRSTPIYPS